MDFKTLFLFGLALIFTVTMFPFPVSATTNVTVTSPNGGEYWGATHNITWTFNDTSLNQTNNFNLFYSNPAGANNYPIAINRSFINDCNTSQSNNWISTPINYVNGLPANVSTTMTFEQWHYGGASYISYFSGETPSGNITTYKWNNSSLIWELQTMNWIGNAFSSCQMRAFGGGGLAISDINGSEYAFFECKFTGTTGKGMYVFKFNGTDWNKTNDYTAGLTDAFAQDVSSYIPTPLEIININGTYYLLGVNITTGTNVTLKGFVWNGSTWTTSTPIKTFDIARGNVRDFSISSLNYNSNTYLIIYGTSDANAYVWSGSNWVTTTTLSSGLPSASIGKAISIGNIANTNILIGGYQLADAANGRTFNFSSSLNYIFSYNTQNVSSCSYSWNTTTANNGAWFIDVNSVETSIGDSSNAEFTIFNFNGTVNTFPITPVQNISTVSYDSNTINLSLLSNFNDTIWSATNNTGASAVVSFSMSNNDTSGSQYFIYTSTDGNTWTFSDTLTFGATNSTPVQKIWDSNNLTYDYSFGDTFSAGQIKYYKLVFQPLPLFWQVLKDSVDWANYNYPSAYIQNSGAHSYDLFADSNLSNIQSFTYKPYPKLTSTDLSAGFYVEFTAYASVATSLKVGYRIGSTDTVSGTISLGTSPNRYAVFVQPSDSNAQILIKSISNTASNVYISDYAIIPASYFVDRLDLFDSLGGSLQSIARSGVSYLYVKEGVGFRDNTRFYNFNGELSQLVTSVKVNGIPVKTYAYDLSSYTQNGTITLSNNLDGVIDFNSQAEKMVDNNLVLASLDDLTVTNTLINNSGESVAEQSQSVKLLQYPYSSGDISFNVYLLNKKVGESPSFSINLIQAYPQAFVGLKFLIFDSSHDVNNPNYSETVYAGDLGCVNQMYCQKTVTLDKFSFPDATSYTVEVALLLTTENQNLDNPLTVSKQVIQTSFTNFETGRVLQVFERRGGIDLVHGEYNQYETIPIVFQARDDKLENMQNQYAVTMSIRWLDENFGVHDNVSPLYPQKFIYDPVTGYNYWYFDQVLHDNTGAVLPNGAIVYARANVTPIKGQGAVSYFGYELKCTTYPSDFSDGSFLMNWAGLVGDEVFGCTSVAPALNPMSDANSFVGDIVAQNVAYISSTYTPTANQNESVFCWNADVNVTYAPDVGNSFMCGVLYKKSEAQIDRFDVTLGNQYSDYSKTGDNIQFIKFSIPAEQVIFNDLAMMRNALILTHNTQGIHTYQDFFAAGLDQLLPDWRISGNINSANFPFLPPTFSFGADVNLAQELSPNVYDGAFFFRINGVKVINQYDYIKANPELETINPSEFRTFASAHGLSVPIKTTTISIFSSDLSNLQNIKVASPLVIFEAPRQAVKSNDSNFSNVSTPPTSLKFDFVVDMFSGNLSQAYRAVVPLYLSYIVGSNTPFNFNTWLPDLINGDNGITTNPVGFATHNWFFFFVLMVIIILGAWVIGQTRR